MRFKLSLLPVCLTACLSDEEIELELSESESAASVAYWTDDVQIPSQASDRQVALTYFGGRTYQVHTADNSTQLRYSRFNGSSWSTQQDIPGQLSDKGPALATFGNRPTLLYKEAGANRFRMSTYYSGAWTAPATAGSALGLTTIKSGPSLAVHQGALLMAYCRDMGTYDRVQVDRYDGTAWSSLIAYALDIGVTCKNVVIGSLPGDRFDLIAHTFQYSYTDGYGSHVYEDFMYEITGVGAPSTSWVWQKMSMRTTKPMSMMHCNGTSHLVHGGFSNPDRIYWSHRTSSGWAQDAYLTGTTSSGGSTLVCHDTRPLMVHNGGYPNLWFHEYIE